MGSVHSDRIRYDRLIDPLIADFRPVKPLWPVKIRLALWLVLELAIVILAVAAGPRTNLAWKLQNWEFLAGVTGLVGVGIMAAASAFRSAIPGEEEMRPGKLMLLMAVGGAAFALMLHEPAHTAVSIRQFVVTGTRCALCVTLFAALPWLALFWASRRAMPLMGATEGGLIGTAAFAFAFAASRMGCPIDEFAHVLVWHALPAAVGAAVSVVAGAIWLQGLKHRPTAN